MNQLQTTITNVDITKPDQFAEFVRTAKVLEDQIKAAWAAVDAQMIEHGIDQLKGDYGTISRAERINWKINLADIDPYYTKPTADTGKLNAAFKAGDTVAGADFTTSVYITKKIKAAA